VNPTHESSDPADEPILTPPPPPGEPKHDPYAVLRLPDFRLFLGGSMLGWLGLQMQTVAVGWYIYERTGSNLAVGLVGLAQVVPVVTLALPAGHAADHFERRRVLMTAESLLMGCSLGLAAVAHWSAPLWILYSLLTLIGIGRAFQGPAKASFLPQIVPREIFSNAVTWNSTGFQLASVLGPSLGGLLIWKLGAASWVFVIDASTTLVFLSCVFAITRPKFVPSNRAPSLRSLGAGFRFVLANQIILAAITLDLFAVLFGGAIALLPSYSKDILAVGSRGLGLLYAAPAIGAMLMALVIAHRPMRRAGRAMLLSVAGFGAATLVFAVSRSFVLSFAMLFLTGVFDAVSVVVRHTLVQVMTPDAMRGRVSAVNGMFISASNELGAFESGLVAWLFFRPDNLAFGPTASVVIGGVATLVVVAIAAIIWPEVRRFGALSGANIGSIGPPVEFDPDGRLASDLPCAGCDYNLRSRARGDACPECGMTVEATLERIANGE
jgi:MFS family permease